MFSIELPHCKQSGGSNTFCELQEKGHSMRDGIISVDHVSIIKLKSGYITCINLNLDGCVIDVKWPNGKTGEYCMEELEFLED